MWTQLRENIEAIRQANKIAENNFKPVDINAWRQIQEKIFFTFCNIQSQNDKFNGLWKHFKQNVYSVHFNRNYPFDSLLQLVDNSEKVWLFINETVNEREKFWFYEGRIEFIIFVLGESIVDEVYIVSKKYEWLLCINHHDVLIATGNTMPEKLMRLHSGNLLRL